MERPWKGYIHWWIMKNIAPTNENKNIMMEVLKIISKNVDLNDTHYGLCTTNNICEERYVEYFSDKFYSKDIPFFVGQRVKKNCNPYKRKSIVFTNKEYFTITDINDDIITIKNNKNDTYEFNVSTFKN